MGEPSGDAVTNIMHLPDDFLFTLFQLLDCKFDRDSFGLTCRRWHQVQNICRRSLQFPCSFTLFSFFSSDTSFRVNQYHLHRLLTRFQHLQSLSLTGCRDLPDSALTPLQCYGSSLKKLLLECCFGITDQGLSMVASGCPSLTVISLYRCKITDTGLGALASHCSALADVNLSSCSLITDNGLASLSQGCRQLRSVTISCCRGVNGIGFSGCSQTLACIDAETCKLEPKGLMGMLSGGGVEYLNISNLSGWIHGDGFTAFGAGFCMRLKTLNLRLCRTVDDKSVEAIAKGCPLLKEWNLALCQEVRIRGWESIGLNCHNLESLHVNGCRNLCAAGLCALQNGCRRLSVLYLTRCILISSTSIELFKLYRGDVQIKEEEVMCIKKPNWDY